MSAGSSTTRRRLLAYFAGQPTPRILLMALLTVVCARLGLGGWSGWDALVAGAVIVVWPLHEWLVHVYVLHAPPFRILGRTFEPKRLSGHAAHHMKPHAWKESFIETRVLAAYLVLLVILWLLLAPSVELGLTGLVVTAGLGIVYEWTHFLIHTDYRPRTQTFRRLWVSHRLHHFKNENYWFGVTMLTGDRVLGTQPDPADVETSGSCRTLGMDAEVAL